MTLATNTTQASDGSTQQMAQRLLAWFDPTACYAVALSGGVDSAVVAKAVALSASDGVAVTATSSSVARRELSDAGLLTASMGLRHEFVEPLELDDPNYSRNDAARCYFCKSRLYSAIRARFPQHIILSGTNADDLDDYRPGLKAAAEAEVRAPLAELSIAKAQVRKLAEFWNLHVADKPASPCLASRIAHGVSVTAERLQRIELAEERLRALGLSELRVRLHEGEVARIEVAPQHFSRLIDPAVQASLVVDLKALGFRFVTLDLEGFRSGSLNPLPIIQPSSR